MSFPRQRGLAGAVRHLALFGGVAIALALLVAYSGLYNVAASAGHAPWIDRFLALGMRRSVIMHSLSVERPELDSPGLVRLGAGHFHVGCGNCHGSPSAPGNPIYEGMLPAPPDLTRHIERWSDEQLFWIVRHGLKYAGMPAWSGAQRDDEIWAVVAFLRELPALDQSAYFALAAGNIRLPPYDGEDLTRLGSTLLPLAACARCHDTRDAPPVSEHVPKLGGQSREYVVEALRQYRDGIRESGFMEPVAADLGEAEIEALADFYAALDSPVWESAPVEGNVGRGRELAEHGAPEAGIPACEACHSADALPLYPRLSGQSAAYLLQQLTLWRDGQRNDSGLGQIMATVGSRLSAQQARDVAAYYQQRSGDLGASQ